MSAKTEAPRPKCQTCGKDAWIDASATTFLPNGLIEDRVFFSDYCIACKIGIKPCE